MTKILIDKADVKQALEALNSVRPQNMTPFISSARTALRQALKQQPADEPVAYMDKYGEIFKTVEVVLLTDKPLYTSPEPAAWVGLTDEEIMAIGKELGLKCRLGGNPNIDFDYARAIEAKLKEKNT